MSLENISPEEFDSALASFGLGGIGNLPVAMHPGSSPGGAISKNERGGKPSLPVSDIGRIREHVSVVIGKGKSKEVFGKNLSQAEVEKLDEKQLLSLEQKYHAFVSSKMTSSLKKGIIALGSKLVSHLLVIKDLPSLQKQLNDDYLINNELEGLFSSISVENTSFACKALSFANAALITLNNTDLEATLKWWSSPLAEGTEVSQLQATKFPPSGGHFSATAQQCSTTSDQFSPTADHCSATPE